MPDEEKIWDAVPAGTDGYRQKQDALLYPILQRLSRFLARKNGLHQRRQFRYLASYWFDTARQREVHICRLKSPVGDRKLPDNIHLSQNGYRALGG